MGQQSKRLVDLLLMVGKTIDVQRTNGDGFIDRIVTFFESPSVVSTTPMVHPPSA